MKKFYESLTGFRRLFLILLLAMSIGALFIIFIGRNPIEAYMVLFRSAFRGNLGFGTMLANFTPLLLTSMAFAVASKAGAFNVGVEGAVFLGGIASAAVGIYVIGLPVWLHILLCFAAAILIGAIWSFIPAILKALYSVSEVCVTILMNYVALFITSYLVAGPMSAGVANAQTHHTLVRLSRFLRPSSANAGLFIAIAIAILLFLIMQYTTFGFQMRTVGNNPKFAEYTGTDPRLILIKGMMLSGIIGGVAGCIEVLGVYGFFQNNFAAGLGFNGMLAALIVKNDLRLVPLMALFLAILQSGALGMQQQIGVPRAVVDTVTAVFIIIATMELLFNFAKKKQSKMDADRAVSPLTEPAIEPAADKDDEKEDV